MKLNVKAVQRQLDLSAEELDKEGLKDLASQVDTISEELESANLDKISEIKAKLLKIVEEQKTRTARKAELLAKVKTRVEEIRASKRAKQARKARLEETSK